MSATAHWITSEGGARTFAWTHLPSDAPRRSTGIQLIAPVGPEYLHSHRAVRHLARELEKRGFVVVRHDHHGMGNSSGDLLDTDTFAQWEAGCEVARKHLRSVPGITDYAAVTLRSGALLSQRLLSENRSAAVVHWFPYLKGSAFVRDLGVIDAMLHLPAPSGPFSEGGGYPLHNAAESALGTCDLLTGPLPATANALIVNDAALPPNDRLRARLAEAGIPADRIEEAGLAAMMRQAEVMEVPAASIVSVVNWLDEKLPSLATELGAPPMQAHFEADQVRESAVELGAERPMFGVLARPSADLRKEPLVVLLNAGAAHHVGANRLHVDLARALAERGFSSLRMDLAHLGDSATGISAEEQHPYAATAAQDVNAALDALAREHGHQRFVLSGLCSGAHNAFQAALAAPAGRIAGLVLLNPLTFYWRAGDDVLKPEASRSEVDAAQYEASARDPRKWLRLLTDPKRLVRVGSSTATIALTRLTRVARSAGQRLGLGVTTRLERDLGALLEQGTKILVITADSEPGYRAMRGEAPRLLSQLAERNRVTVSILTDSDHTFSSLAARRDLINRIVAHLMEQHS